MIRFRRWIVCALGATAVAAAGFGETPSIVVPVVSTPTGLDQPLPIPLALLGIDSYRAVVSGALRGEVTVGATEVLYAPHSEAFARTTMDVFRVEDRGTGVAWSVIMVGSSSTFRQSLRSHAGTGVAADVGWDVVGDVVWDPVTEAYEVTGDGELGFDFARDGVVGLFLFDDLQGGQSGSGSSVTLRPPPPPPGGLTGGAGELLVYQGGGAGDELWQLWLQAEGGVYTLRVELISGTGQVAEEVLSLPPDPSFEVELSQTNHNIVAYVRGSVDTTTSLPQPPDFDLDRSWHRFGRLASAGPAGWPEGSLGLDEIEVETWSLDLTRQVVVVDDFEADAWSSAWQSPGIGALRIGSGAGEMSTVPWHNRVLIASLDRANLLGPDFLERVLDVPRVAMSCRLFLDLTMLSSRGPAFGAATVLTLRDETQPDPAARDYARLLVGHQNGEHRLRLEATGSEPDASTPWIPLAGPAAVVEVQWRKTEIGERVAELWIDGCGPAAGDCVPGWKAVGTGQPGLITAVRLGAVADFADAVGSVGFDNVVCAGDSWVGTE